MEEKQVRRYLRRCFNPVGWTLVLYYLIMNIMVMLTYVVDVLYYRLKTLTAGGNFSELVQNAGSNGWGYLLAIAVGLMAALCWKGPDFWKYEIFAKRRSMTGGTFFALLSVFFGCQVAGSLLTNLLEWILNRFGLSALGIYDLVSGSTDTFSMFLYASVIGPLAEEILFRGYIQRTLQPFGKKFSIFCSAFLFGMFHGNLVQTPYAFLVGLVLGYVTAEYSILWAMVLHLINNLVLADLMGRLTTRLPELAGELLLSGILWVFAIAAVVILIRRRREVRAYLAAEWMDRRCLKCFFLCSGVVIFSLMMVVNMILMLFV